MVLLHDARHDAEAEAGALADVLGGVEGVEDACLVLFRNADAVVFHGHHEPLTLTAGRDPNLARMAVGPGDDRVIGVGQQVRPDLMNVAGTRDRRQVIRQFRGQLHAVTELIAQQHQRGGDRIVDLDRLHPLSVGMGVVFQRLHDLRDLLRAGFGDHRRLSHVGAGLGQREEALVPETGGVPSNRRLVGEAQLAQSRAAATELWHSHLLEQALHLTLQLVGGRRVWRARDRQQRFQAGDHLLRRHLAGAEPERSEVAGQRGETLEQVARHVENRADRSIDLVGHARDQDTQRGHLLVQHHLALRVFQVFIGLCQLGRGLPHSDLQVAVVVLDLTPREL